MAHNIPNYDHVAVKQKTKIETTYEYVPILGEVLGYWRKSASRRIGKDVEVHLNHSLMEYDRLFVNGIEIQIPDKARTD